MATPSWQPGKLYPPGALVVPRTVPPSVPIVVENGGFAGGAAGWTLSGGAQYDGTKGYGGPGCVRLPGNVAAGLALNNSKLYAALGSSITAAAVIEQGASIADATSGWVEVQWFDSADVLVRTDRGNVVRDGSGGAWHQSRVVSQRPGGALYARAGIHLTSVADHSHAIWGDALTVSGTSATLADMQYKAVQAATGYSDTVEPVWPGVLGETVVDHEVTWEAVRVSRVVWEARPILKSGATEPVWPMSSGARVPDGTISWETVSRFIEDPNCPKSDIVLIASSKVYAGDKDIVRFSATVNPLDWSSPEDAGYLPTGLQQYGANPVAAMGLYRGNLIPFNAEAFQMWQIDEDPASMALLDAMPIGSTRHNALTPVSGDLFFLASQGVRSIGIAGGSTNLQAGDVGMPIDPMVQQAMMAADAAGLEPLGLYYPAAGQYWLIFNTEGAGDGGAQTAEVFVYTMTRLGSVGAWSRYLFPFPIDDWAIKGDDLYLRAGDRVMRVSDDLVGDKLDPDASALPAPGLIQWPWLDFGAPGQTKRLLGVDVVSEGAPSIEIGYDQSAQGVFTEPYQLPADTVPGMVVPMELSAPSLSVRLTFDGEGPWHFLALNLYFSDNRMMS